MFRKAKSPVWVLVCVCVGVPGLSLVACSSDPATTADAGPTTSTTTTSTATSTSTSTPDAATPDAATSPDAATADAQTDGGTCAARGKSDLKIDPAISSTTADNKVTVQLVDTCQGTGAAQAYTGTRLRFEPTDNTNHYFLVTSTNPADFYKSASVVWNFGLAGVRSDTDMKIVAKPGVGGATDIFGANYDATKAHFVVQLNRLAATCDVSGYTVSVVGHPEAVVQYTNGGSFAVDPALTMSAGDRGAFAYISKVNVGSGLVDIVGTKPGCKLVGVAFPAPITTNKYPLVADTATYLVMNTAVQ
jgi:hypothetical protein